jgi:hypothetical protein
MKLLKKDLRNNEINKDRFNDLNIKSNLKFIFKNKDKSYMFYDVVKVMYNKELELLEVTYLNNNIDNLAYVDLKDIKSIHQL